MTPQEKKKNAHLIDKYGITLDQYNQRLKDQDYKCAMCSKPASECKRALHVDHNHGKSKRVRGLVCFYCNRELIRRHSLKTATLLYQYMLRFESEVQHVPTTSLERMKSDATTLSESKADPTSKSGG